MRDLHPALPPRVSWPWMLGAAGVWMVVALIGTPAHPPIPPGGFTGELKLVSDVFQGPYGYWTLAEMGDGIVLVELDADIAGRGDTLIVEGSIGGRPGTAAGKGYGAVLAITETIEHKPSGFLPHRAGIAVRRTVVDRLQPLEDRRALLAGFLIGDTSGISDADRDAMRKSGLAHFVAVSGSNVALFLALLSVAAGPLALGPRRRALVGLLGLPIYAAATRFEPSVMRATVMAALALSGRLAGIVLEAWQLLSLAVALLLLADSDLVSNVGFQLSVAATCGVLVGARWPLRHVATRALAVTIGAQLAVAPLLLIHFGTVPLLSPVVNVAAGPLVAAATVIGAVGVAGVGFLVPVASVLAGLVLGLARGAAGWPQLGAVQVLAIVSVGLVVVLLPAVRRFAAAGAAIALCVTMISPATALQASSVVVLDVGQGDAILIHGGDERYVLVDGGPDPAILIDRLRHYRVRALEVVVATHVHADHVTGLAGIVGQIPIGEVWADTEPHSTPAYDDLFVVVDQAQIPMVAPQQGDRIQVGGLTITVHAPLRRYASPNDQSIVLSVDGPARSMLLSGDIETFAQTDLDTLRADVLKVPHQGAGTSDPEWLAQVGASLAIISVGPNQFGHPVPWVMETLAQSGAEVLRTDEEGDVVVDLSVQSEAHGK